MTLWNRRLPPVDGRRLIEGLGGLYIALAAVYPLISSVAEVPLGVHLVVAVLVGGPGLVLLYGGHRLTRTDIRPDLFPSIARWCLGGVAVTLGVLLLTVFAADTTNLVTNALILTALGSTAGFIAGTYSARVKTRERDLQETVEQLRTSNERLEQFAYAASHDLQEPLRMVSSYLQLLESRYGEDLDGDAREFIGFAVDGADRMRVMVENLHEYSRVTNRGEPLEPIDAEDALNDALTDLQLLIQETDATITADELPTVTGDPNQLAQVFRNLLSNAMKHGGEADPTIHVSAERTGDAWRFSVVDRGIGIAPEYHDRIFEVFQQLQRDEGAEIGSSGIGLALSERIVERHGGEIWVESEPGEGASFYFTVPVAQDRRSETPGESAAPA